MPITGLGVLSQAHPLHQAESGWRCMGCRLVYGDQATMLEEEWVKEGKQHTFLHRCPNSCSFGWEGSCAYQFA